jgi:hypothetical protein
VNPVDTGVAAVAESDRRIEPRSATGKGVYPTGRFAYPASKLGCPTGKGVTPVNRRAAPRKRMVRLTQRGMASPLVV